MPAILIKSNSAKNLKLLADLAQRLGDQTASVNAETLEDLLLGERIKTERTGVKADKQKVLRMLGMQ